MKLIPEYSRLGFCVGIRLNPKTRAPRGAQRHRGGRRYWKATDSRKLLWLVLVLTPNDRKAACTQEALVATYSRRRRFGRGLLAIDHPVFMIPCPP